MSCIGLILPLIAILFVFSGIARAQGSEGTPSPSPSPSSETPQATAPVVEIRSPAPGGALRGSVAILGNSQIAGFASAEVSFAYSGDPTGTWFIINESSQPVANGLLAQWDTNAITDGVYNLRLVVTIQDGSRQQVVVTGLRVRNYTPVETDTPTPVTPTATLVPGDTPVPTATATAPARPTPTLLPTNPAEITRLDVLSSLGRGVLAVIGLFALMAIFALVKRLGEKE